jgi:hypothetical protein
MLKGIYSFNLEYCESNYTHLQLCLQLSAPWSVDSNIFPKQDASVLIF